MKNIKVKIEWAWIIKITIITFSASLLFSLASDTVIPRVNIIISIFLILLFILIGILADMVGLATAACDTKSFHSMSAKKITTAKIAINMVRNAEKVSSFCNDVLGDICGIVSGSGGASLAIMISKIYDLNLLFISLIITAIIASLTVAGKAIFKSFAVNQSENIVFLVARLIRIFNFK